MQASPPRSLPPLPATPAEGYRELVELDRAQTVRRARRVVPIRTLEPDRIDLEVLTTIAALRHVLSSQVHRRINRGRSPSTTQRRLKRLADAGLVERFQFHRRDGGGVPMCYALTADGLRVLELRNGHTDCSDRKPLDARVPAIRHASLGGPQRLKQARHDIHVAGWVLALACALGESFIALCGAEESALSAPQRATSAGRLALGPGDLRLPGGRAPHDFLSTEAAGRRVPVERFETLRPDAIVRVFGDVDLIVERDDRLEDPRAVAKLSAMTTSSRAGRPTPSATAGAGGLYPWWCTCVVTANVRGNARGAPTLSCAHVEPTPGSIHLTGSTRAGRGPCLRQSAMYTRGS